MKIVNKLISQVSNVQEVQSMRARVANSKIQDHFDSSFQKFEVKLQKEAKVFLNDVETLAKRIKGVVFDRATHEPNILKNKARTLEKFRDKGVITDPIRTTIYMQNANVNYASVITEMDKLGYKVILNKSTPDITVRFGETAKSSGYEDVAIKFTKKKASHQIFREIIILPGHNYHRAKEQEHKIYEALRLYDGMQITNPKVNSTLDIINTEMNKLSKKMYRNAKTIDSAGLGKGENISLTKIGYTLLKNQLFELRTLYKKDMMSKLNTTNEAVIAKKLSQSKDYAILKKAEAELKVILEKYKPA